MPIQVGSFSFSFVFEKPAIFENEIHSQLSAQILN